MQIVNAGVSGWIWDDLEVPGVDTVQIQDVDPINSWGKIVDFGCRTTRNINDVFFWNNHLAFFVGDGGFLCRYSLRPDPHGGPGLNIAKALLADRDPETKEPYLKWEAQGADEQALNWGKIVDEPAYRYANFRSVFCLQVGPINIDEWVAFEMNADLGGSTPHSNLHPLILTLTRTLTPTLTRTLTPTLTLTLTLTLTVPLTLTPTLTVTPTLTLTLTLTLTPTRHHVLAAHHVLRSRLASGRRGHHLGHPTLHLQVGLPRDEREWQPELPNPNAKPKPNPNAKPKPNPNAKPNPNPNAKPNPNPNPSPSPNQASPSSRSSSSGSRRTAAPTSPSTTSTASRAEMGPIGSVPT